MILDRPETNAEILQSMDPVRVAQARLLAALRGKRGFNGIGIHQDISGRPELYVLWLRGVAIPSFPSSVNGVPILIRITSPIVARTRIGSRSMGPVQVAKTKLREALRAHRGRGYNGIAISKDPAGNSELHVLWLRGIAIPPFPSSVNGIPITIRITPPIVAQEQQVGSWYDPYTSAARDAWEDYKQTMREFYRGHE